MTYLLSPVTNENEYQDNDGLPAVGGKIFFYEAGSFSADQTAYSDSSGTPLVQPLVLNSSGRPPVTVYLDSTKTYNIVLTASDGTTVWRSWDNVIGVGVATGAVTSIIAGTGITIDPISGVGDVTINASGGGGFTATKCVSVWESSWSNGNPIGVTFSLSESDYDINTDYITVNLDDGNITFIHAGLYSVQYQWTIQSHFTDDYRWDWNLTDGSVTITANSEITEAATYFISTSTQAFNADDIYTPSANLETYSGNDVATGSALLTLTVEYLGPQPD